MRIVSAFLLAALVVSMAATTIGCVAPADDDIDTADTTTETDTDTEPQTPVTPVVDGTYRVRTEIDLTVEAVLPATAHDMVVTLRDFSTNPARTMFDTAEDAGVSAVQDIRDALPQYVEEKLEGWINGEIAKVTVNGVPITQIAGDIAALAELSLTTFAIDSELAIDGTTATHSLVTLDLAPAGLAAQFSLAALHAEVRTATTTCTMTAETLELGAHGFALPYGEYVWQALEANTRAAYGTDIRGLIGTAVNCPALATTISNKCAWGYCVGHRPELLEICERGLDEVVERVHARFAEKKLDALSLARGMATLVDAVTRDGTVEAMTGVWQAQINVGQGLRNAPATFSATR